MNDKYGRYGAQAEQLYVHGKTLEEISLVTGVSPTSLSKWKNEHDWDSKRKKYRATGAGSAFILEDAIAQVLGRIEENGIDSGDADEIVKLTKALKELRKSDDLFAMTTIVMDKFIDYVNTRYSTGSDEDREAKSLIHDTLGGFFNYIERRK